MPRNVVTGLANLGHETLNLPHNLTEAAEDATQNTGITTPSFMPQEFQKNIKLQQAPKISEYIPQQQEYDYAKILGQKGEPTFADTLVQKGTEHIQIY